MNMLSWLRSPLCLTAVLLLALVSLGCDAGAEGAVPEEAGDTTTPAVQAAVQAAGTDATTPAGTDDGTDDGTAPAAAEDPDWPFPVPESECARYTAYRATGPIVVDGKLDEADWQNVPRSPRFRDLVSGDEVVHDTRAAITWDDENLYVGFWVEEPFVEAKHLNRDAPIYTENDIEMFIAGADSYYEFEMNAHGTIYEGLFIWEDAYDRGGYAEEPMLARDHPQSAAFHGIRFKPHPRGPRLVCFGYDFPNLQSAVYIDGTLNDNSDRDGGWTAELAVPWEGMKWLAVGDGRSLPPTDGDVWRIDFSRFNYYRAAPIPPATETTDCGGWVWSPHGTYDSHVPEVYPFITFSSEPIPSAAESP